MGRSLARGRDGAPGMPGPIPRHEWEGTCVRFQKNDRDWGDWIELKGQRGEPGLTSFQHAVEKGFEGSLEDWLRSLVGKDGSSAYEIAVQNGFVGSVTEWLLSLKGDKGDKGESGKSGTNGTDGVDGIDGVDGLSAYEVWLQQGNTGSENDFFDWIARKVREKINSIGSGGGSLKLKLGALKDVDVSNAHENDVLKYKSGSWIAGQPWISLTTAEYEAIDIPDPSTLYLITDAS